MAVSRKPFTVGRSGFATLQQAFDAVRPGETIQATGSIRCAPAILATADVTLRGPAVLRAHATSTEDNALITATAPGFRLEGIEADLAGAGDAVVFLRFDADGDLVLRRCHVRNGAQGLRIADGCPCARVLLEDCVFERLGNPLRQMPAIDVGGIAELRVRDGRYEDAKATNCIVSHARTTLIERALLRWNSKSHAVELPDGGVVEIEGCTIVRDDAATGESDLIAYGSAGRSWARNTFHFYASNRIIGNRARANAIVAFGFQPEVMLAEMPRSGLATKPQPSNVPSAATYLQLADTSLDGATWLFANKVLAIAWNNPGGDWRDAREQAQGAAAYATASIGSQAAPQDVKFDVTALAKRWLDEGNTGLHLRSLSGPPVSIASRRHQAEPGPILEIVTEVQRYQCPCIASIWVDRSSANPLQNAVIGPQSLMRFDLSQVAGSLIHATLQLRILNVYSGRLPTVLAVNRLDMPRLVTDPARQVGGVVTGIAAAVSHDSALAAHPDVLTYDDLIDESYIKNHYLVVPPTSVGGIKFELDRKYAFTWAHCYGNATAQRTVAWHKWAQPLSAPPHNLDNARWRRPYKRGQGLGYDEIYFRFMFRIGADLRAAFNENGMKLPGLGGTYSWSSSGAVTLPAPPADGIWEARLWHSKGSDAHPHLYRGATYWYGADHPLSRYSGDGSTRYFNRMNFCFQAEQSYCIEQQVKLNTISADAGPNADGIYRVWVDGVLVHEQTDLLIRKYPEVQIQDLPFVNIYHGGMGLPKGIYHESLASLVTATRYIGPPNAAPAVPRSV